MKIGLKIKRYICQSNFQGQKKLTAGFGTEGLSVYSEMVVHFYIKAVDNILNYFF